MIMPKNYLCVFIADTSNKNDVVDKMDDPCFSPPWPTWGVCRPNTRYAVDIGSYIVFLGGYPQNEYFVKGIIRVGGLLNYAEAVAQFPKRKNSLIRESQTVLNPMQTIKRRKDSTEIKDEIERITNKTGTIPSFLTTIKYNNKTYVQGPEDNHEIDNWKCRRIFNCQDKTLLKCLQLGGCKKEKQFSERRGYIVADFWHDVGKLRIPWSQVCPDSIRDTDLKTPYNQHNAIELDKNEVREIIDKLKQLSAGKGPKSQFKEYRK